MRHSLQRTSVRAQASTLVRVATPGVEAAEGVCRPDTVVESAKWCTEQVFQPLVVPRGVPSDGADKGGVSPLLLVEEGLVSDIFLEVADHRISLIDAGGHLVEFTFLHVQIVGVDLGTWSTFRVRR